MPRNNYSCAEKRHLLYFSNSAAFNGQEVNDTHYWFITNINIVNCLYIEETRDRKTANAHGAFIVQAMRTRAVSVWTSVRSSHSGVTQTRSVTQFAFQAPRVSRKTVQREIVRPREEKRKEQIASARCETIRVPECIVINLTTSSSTFHCAANSRVINAYWLLKPDETRAFRRIFSTDSNSVRKKRSSE